MRSIHIYDAFFLGGGGGGEKPSFARQKEEHRIWPSLHVLHAALARQRLRAGTRAADTPVMVLECIVGRVGASKLDESATYRSLTKVLCIEAWTKVLRILCQPRTDIFSRHGLGQNPPSPKRRVFVFSLISLITDWPLSIITLPKTSQSFLPIELWEYSA